MKIIWLLALPVFMALKSEANQREKAFEALKIFAPLSCRQFEGAAGLEALVLEEAGGAAFSPLQPEKAEELALCLLDSDYWSARDEFDSLSRGAGVGLFIKCSKARGLLCSGNFLEFSADLSHYMKSSRIHFVEREGRYRFDGWGASSKAAIIMPSAGNVHVKAEDHSRVYFGPGAVCEGSSRHCLNLGELSP